MPLSWKGLILRALTLKQMVKFLSTRLLNVYYNWDNICPNFIAANTHKNAYMFEYIII